MVYITAIHMCLGGSAHNHIEEYKWRNPTDGETGKSSKAIMVDWLKNKNGVARVTDGTTTVDVRIVEANPPYLQTVADGRLTNNLLSLPRY